ncbi:hypothetical protein [Chitinophaga flava]|nr:hypothetical protein [Chitinophaga flava]
MKRLLDNMSVRGWACAFTAMVAVDVFGGIIPGKGGYALFADNDGITQRK